MKFQCIKEQSTYRNVGVFILPQNLMYISKEKRMEVEI
nr:MAG TPA: hypothetical protein [Caudoviricetes sp.]